MLLQLITQEGSIFEQEAGAPTECRKSKLTRKNKFARRLKEDQDITPRQGEVIHESEADLCVAVWRSVVVQAMYDLSGHGGQIERRVQRAEARSWFSGSEEESDFEMVCDLACLTPSHVRKVAKQVSERGEEIGCGFNFRTLRKHYSNRTPNKRATLKD